MTELSFKYKASLREGARLPDAHLNADFMVLTGKAQQSQMSNGLEKVMSSAAVPGCAV